MLILYGETASGKDTIKSKLIEFGMEPVKEYTTRPMRDGETQGEQYYFISDREFEKLKEAGYFKTVCKYERVDAVVKYAIANKEFNLSNSINKVLVTNPIAIQQIIASGKSSNNKYCRITASREAIERRIKKRGDMLEEMVRRLAADKIEFDKLEKILKPDIVVENSIDGIDIEALAKSVCTKYYKSFVSRIDTTI